MVGLVFENRETFLAEISTLNFDLLVHCRERSFSILESAGQLKNRAANSQAVLIKFEFTENLWRV